MKIDSFYQFIMRQISKNPINRMHLPTFTRVIRKKAQHVSTAQLLYVYKELQRFKQFPLQFQSHHLPRQSNQRTRLAESKSEIKIESYQKHSLICLQEIVIKLKEKNGYQQGADLCKLAYLRLLNAIEYHLPYLIVLEQFREQFLWKEIGEQIIDYVGLIDKDPSSLSHLYRQTVGLIVQTVSEELQNIDVLQLPYLKSTLSRARTYAVYDINDQLIQKLDALINTNKFVYTFKELETSIASDLKNTQTHHYYSSICKDPLQKKLNYLYLNSKNQTQNQNSHSTLNDLKSQVGLPGKNLIQDNIDFVLNKITQIQLFGTYLNIFGHSHNQSDIIKTQTLKQYFRYHFTYFLKSGNSKCQIQQIISTLKNTLQSQQKMNQNGLKFQHLEPLRLFSVIYMLTKKPINSNNLIGSHQSLQEELKSLNLIQKPRLQNFSKLFEDSLKNSKIDQQNLSKITPIINLFASFIQASDDNIITEIVSQELQTFSPLQKIFLMNQLILSIINALIQNHSTEYIYTIKRLLNIFIKLQFKKFSTESSNVQKLLNLIQQKQKLSSSQQLSSINLLQQNYKFNETQDGSGFQSSQKITEKQRTEQIKL